MRWSCDAFECINCILVSSFGFLNLAVGIAKKVIADKCISSDQSLARDRG